MKGRSVLLVCVVKLIKVTPLTGTPAISLFGRCCNNGISVLLLVSLGHTISGVLIRSTSSKDLSAISSVT